MLREKPWFVNEKGQQRREKDLPGQRGANSAKAASFLFPSDDYSENETEKERERGGRERPRTKPVDGESVSGDRLEDHHLGAASRKAVKKGLARKPTGPTRSFTLTKTNWMREPLRGQTPAPREKLATKLSSPGRKVALGSTA